jgi:hypothetical protein
MPGVASQVCIGQGCKVQDIWAQAAGCRQAAAPASTHKVAPSIDSWELIRMAMLLRGTWRQGSRGAMSYDCRMRHACHANAFASAAAGRPPLRRCSLVQLLQAQANDGVQDPPAHPTPPPHTHAPAWPPCQTAAPRTCANTRPSSWCCAQSAAGRRPGLQDAMAVRSGAWQSEPRQQQAPRSQVCRVPGARQGWLWQGCAGRQGACLGPASALLELD